MIKRKKFADRYKLPLRFAISLKGLWGLFTVETLLEKKGKLNGEPSLSAGRPMLNLLVSEGLTNVVVVTTRYFGGIKLGKGGLVRAYTAVCKGAVEKACTAAAYSISLDRKSVV